MTSPSLIKKITLHSIHHKSQQLYIKIITVCLIALSITISPCESARTRLRNTLDVKFNLGCQLPQCNSTDPEKPAVNLFQVVSSNPESQDKTNFIWSNIGGPPMVITTSSSQESSLLIDWDLLLNTKANNNNNSKQSNETTSQPTTSSAQPAPAQAPPKTDGFHFNVTPDAAIGLLVEKIIFFDDTDHSGLFTKDKEYFEVEWSDIIWDLASRTTYHKDDFLKTHLRIRPKHPYFNGNILIKLAIPRDYKADRQKEVPHLKLNNQSISMVIVVDGIQPKPRFKNLRLALSFVVVIQSPNGPVSLDTISESLISDEYTPGVFRIKSLQFKTKSGTTTQSNSQQTGTDQISSNFADTEGQTEVLTTKQPTKKPPTDNLGFLYWKEVAYTDRRKIISRTIDVFDQRRSIDMDSLPNISQPFYQYFKYKPTSGLVPDYRAYRFELIFGKDNASYSSTNFTDFSFVFGLGAAPQEIMFSWFVKVIIFICFCLPILVMLAGLTYLLLRRFRRNGDTELLLAAES